MVGRGVDADEDGGAGLGEVLDRILAVEAALPELLVVPGVLADGEGDLVAAEIEECLALGGQEVAGLVEDVVSGQQHLRLREEDAAALDDGGAVGGAFAGGGPRAAGVSADDGGRERGGFGGEPRELLFGPFEKSWFFDEVARRVAVDGELGEDGDVRALAGCFAGRTDYALGIAGEIADRRIDLRESDPHELLLY